MALKVREMRSQELFAGISVTAVASPSGADLESDLPMTTKTRAARAVRPASTSRTQLLDAGKDQRFRVFVQDLFAISAQMDALRGKFALIAGVTGPQYSILVSIAHLSAGGNGVAVGRLAGHLHVSGTYVTAESKKLEARGYLARIATPDDRRVVLLRLSPAGWALMDDVLPAVRAANDELFRALGRREFAVLCNAFSKLVETGADALLVVEPFVGKRRRASRQIPL